MAAVPPESTSPEGGVGTTLTQSLLLSRTSTDVSVAGGQHVPMWYADRVDVLEETPLQSPRSVEGVGEEVLRCRIAFGTALTELGTKMGRPFSAEEVGGAVDAAFKELGINTNSSKPSTSAADCMPLAAEIIDRLKRFKPDSRLAHASGLPKVGFLINEGKGKIPDVNHQPSFTPIDRRLLFEREFSVGGVPITPEGLSGKEFGFWGRLDSFAAEKYGDDAANTSALASDLYKVMEAIRRGELVKNVPANARLQIVFIEPHLEMKTRG